jgi:ribosomal protein S27AE
MVDGGSVKTVLKGEKEMSKTELKAKKKINLDDVVKKKKVCPKCGDCGFFPKDKKCSLCGKKLVTIRTLWIQCGFLSSWHRNDHGKNKNNPHIKWEVTTGMIPPEILDDIVDKIVFGRSSVSLKLEFLEEKKEKK